MPLVHPQVNNGYPHSVYLQPSVIPAASTSVIGSEAVIEKLVEAVNKMTMQLQEKKRPPREYSKEFLAKTVCFKCGKPGHISQICQENIKNVNTVVTDQDENVVVNKETFQALLSLLDNKKEEEARDQPTYLSFREEDLSLFLPAERRGRKKPSLNAPFKKRKGDSIEPDGSVEEPKNEDNQVQEDVSMDEANLEDLLENENPEPSKERLEEPSKESEVPRKSEDIKEKPVPKEKLTKRNKLKRRLAMSRDPELYEEPSMSWDSEDEYWFKDEQSSLSSSSTDLISLTSDEETDENCDEILTSSLPPLPQDSDELTLRPRRAMTLSTTYLLGEGDGPIIDLLDFYYEGKIPDIANRVGKLPQNFQDQFENFLQNHRSKSYEIGDQVLLQRSEIQHSKSAKLEVQCSGSYYIHNVLGNGTYKLRAITGTDLPGSLIIDQHHVEYGIEIEKNELDISITSGLIWKTTYRTYQLYSIRGLSNLLTSRYITPSILFRMYNEDFCKLLEEAQSIRGSEIDHLIDSANDLLETQIQD
ncbi:3302_t:CDS:2, partial [Racocetra fulgida]